VSGCRGNRHPVLRIRKDLGHLLDTEMTAAKDFFLRFSGEQAIETTAYGQVLNRSAKKLARIYITGLRVAEEEKFLCSGHQARPQSGAHECR